MTAATARGAILAAVLGFGIVAGDARAQTVAAPPKATSSAAAACARSPERRHFDFWIGDWDAFDVGGPKTPSARVRVMPILGGCALHERYDGADGHAGESFTVYDSGRKVWHQTWVTNRGGLLTIEGRFDRNAATLEGPRWAADGRKEIVRGTWKPEGRGVRETAWTSDDGANWKPLFDILFLPHAGD